MMLDSLSPPHNLEDQAERRGFTLVEMMVVVAITAVLAAIIAPAASTLIRGTDLTRGGQMISDQLGFGRQAALSMNCAVEVRFYQYADPGIPGDVAPGKYHAVQIFQILDSGSAAPLGKVQVLPTSIIIDSGSTLSTTLSSILGSALASPNVPTLVISGTGNIPIPRVGTAYNFISFRFQPDGSTNLSPPTGSWFLTLHSITDGDALDSPPANFFNLWLDAYNGHIRTFRP
jgi:uncharacterized protein (TIGR02596 family)